MFEATPGPARLRLRIGGRSGPTLLLLHGLGATAEVWAGVAAEASRRWPGRWVAPDLPGHGGSEPPPEFTFGAMAAAIAASLADTGPSDAGPSDTGPSDTGPSDTGSPDTGSPDAGPAVIGAPVVVLGHSLGGVLALELASGRYGLPVAGAIGLGIKVAWTPAELERAGALARRPPAMFTTEGEAVSRHLKVAGLTGLVPADDHRARAGVAPAGGQWRLAMDPRAFGVGAPDMPALLAAARCRVLLAAGEHDPMSRPEQLRALRADAVTLRGLGHNAHVEDPVAAYGLVASWQDSPDGTG